MGVVVGLFSEDWTVLAPRVIDRPYASMCSRMGLPHVEDGLPVWGPSGFGRSGSVLTVAGQRFYARPVWPHRVELRAFQGFELPQRMRREDDEVSLGGPVGVTRQHVPRG